MSKAVAAMLAGLSLAGASGYLTSAALSGSSAEQPARTVTIEVGEPGPPGPPGPAGPPGSSTCPAGYSSGRLVINHPGGQTAIWTCLAD